MMQKISKEKNNLIKLLSFFLVIFLCFFVFFFYFFFRNDPDKFFFRPQNIRGSALQYREKIYTLNFEQQNYFLSSVNKAKRKKATLLSDKEKHEKIQQLILYFFDDSSIAFIPFGKNEIKGFNASWKNETWNFVLNDPTHFNQFIGKTYDP